MEKTKTGYTNTERCIIGDHCEYGVRKKRKRIIIIIIIIIIMIKTVIIIIIIMGMGMIFLLPSIAQG